MKIRVLKELPWAKVGDVFELTKDRQWVFDINNYRIRLGDECVDQMYADYWIEFVEEKKTLKEKLANMVVQRHGGYYWDEVIEICRQHFLEALPKTGLCTKETLSAREECRKAIEEAN